MTVNNIERLLNAATPFLLALTPFLVVLDMLLARILHRRTKRVEKGLNELKNGELKAKVRQALAEHQEDQETV